jgi:hypothetical protein
MSRGAALIRGNGFITRAIQRRAWPPWRFMEAEAGEACAAVRRPELLVRVAFRSRMPIASSADTRSRKVDACADSGSAMWPARIAGYIRALHRKSGCLGGDRTALLAQDLVIAPEWSAIRTLARKGLRGDQSDTSPRRLPANYAPKEGIRPKFRMASPGPGLERLA